MNKSEIILIGGGGHCKSCIDVIEAEDKYVIKGIIDRTENLGKKILGHEIIGVDEDLKDLVSNNRYFLITVGQIKSNELRVKLFNYLKNLNAKMPIIISPEAYVSKHALIEDGTIIMHDAIINSEASIGTNSIINSKSLIEHDVVIGSHTHISTGAILNGNVRVGNSCFIGSGTILKNGVNLVDNVVLGSASYAAKDILERGTYIGVPAKKNK